MSTDRPAITAPDGVAGHLRQENAIWVPFDPTRLVELARGQAPDLPELPKLLAECRRGGWRCAAYVQFVPRIPAGAISTTVVLEAEDGEEYALDVDRAGHPLGVELLRVAMSDAHASEDASWRDRVRLMWRDNR